MIFPTPTNLAYVCTFSGFSFTVFNMLYHVLLCFTMLYHVLLCFTTLHHVLLGFTGFSPCHRFLYCQGNTMFHTWKKRFFAIVQFSEYKFLLCHFKPKNSHPKQLLVLEGFVADFAETKVPIG